MSSDLGVSFFVAFYDLDPTEQSQCIFFTKKKARCKFTCQDNERARELYHEFNSPSAGIPNLEQLQEYARCNCCGPKPYGARHQNRIEDIELLLPLAERWQEEIKQRAEQQTTTQNTPPEATTPGLAPNDITEPIPQTTPQKPDRQVITQSQIPDDTDPAHVASPSANTPSSDLLSDLINSEAQPIQDEPRYDLRPRPAVDSEKSRRARIFATPQVPLSEFRPHAEEPDETVSSKIQTPLIKDDFKTGWLYIFDRASSPGYVKIGYTSRSVQGRLDSWSKCGYTPNLLFSTSNIPYAQRAETLTHYELIKEWRAERRCKGCSKSHREWFEVSKTRAEQVVRDWAEFMKAAEPYEEDGSFKSTWRRIVESMEKAGRAITANSLLTYHKDLVAIESALLDELSLSDEEDIYSDWGVKTEDATTDLSSIPTKNPAGVSVLDLTQSSILTNQPSVAGVKSVTPWEFSFDAAPGKTGSSLMSLQAKTESILRTDFKALFTSIPKEEESLATIPLLAAVPPVDLKFNFSFNPTLKGQLRSGLRPAPAASRGIDFKLGFECPNRIKKSLDHVAPVRVGQSAEPAGLRAGDSAPKEEKDADETKSSNALDSIGDLRSLDIQLDLRPERRSDLGRIEEKEGNSQVIMEGNGPSTKSNLKPAVAVVPIVS